MISDAGTPGVSDPGRELVAAAVHAGLTVTPIPGPAAPLALWSAAGVRGADLRLRRVSAASRGRAPPGAAGDRRRGRADDRLRIAASRRRDAV